jgi:hypothetical protein
MSVFNGMNTKRKFLHLVDLRVQRYFAGRKGIGFPTLEHEQSLEALTEDAAQFKGLSLANAAPRPSAL